MPTCVAEWRSCFFAIDTCWDACVTCIYPPYEQVLSQRFPLIVRDATAVPTPEFDNFYLDFNGGPPHHSRHPRVCFPMPFAHTLTLASAPPHTQG